MTSFRNWTTSMNVCLYRLVWPYWNLLFNWRKYFLQHLRISTHVSNTYTWPILWNILRRILQVVYNLRISRPCGNLKLITNGYQSNCLLFYHLGKPYVRNSLISRMENKCLQSATENKTNKINKTSKPTHGYLCSELLFLTWTKLVVFHTTWCFKTLLYLRECSWIKQS